MTFTTSQLLLAALTGSTVAYQGHVHMHKRHNQASVGMPYGYANGTLPTGTAAGPTGTGISSSTNTGNEYSETRHTKITKTIYVTADRPTQSAVAAVAGKDAVNTAPALQDTKAGTCPTAAVTVTVPAVVTVTVTAGQEPTSAPESTVYAATADAGTTAASSSATVQAQVANKNVDSNRNGNGRAYGGQWSSRKSSSSASSVQQPASSAPSTQAQAAVPTTQAQAPAPAQTSAKTSAQAPVQSTPVSYSQSPVKVSSPAAAPTTTAAHTTAAAPSSYVQPTTSAVATAAPVCKRGVSSKKGCAATKDQRNNCKVLNDAGAGMSWLYDWEAPNADLAGMEYIPMYHMIDPEWIGWFRQSDAAKTAKYIMNVNEPMIAGEAAAGRTVTQAEVEAAYPAFKAACNPDAKILSPSICGSPEGIEWLAGFNKDYYQIVNAHYYETCDSMQTAKNLKSYLDDVKKIADGKPIWLTEFGCHASNHGTPDQIKQFMQAATELLEGDSQIERYSWFMADSDPTNALGYLMDGNSVSPFGTSYASIGCN